ncbi:hypothetical protein NHX12_033111 [Muraenolepis orangiensis]|uniref:Uncharacterized protein n=1 Tax=Muraenolepis orangiensis TaxID=630683 RepID=A0A9Q0E4W8_9TELE|nr:hypothetical protein NHX12_033111 [Muraenolepis orangiensis]
MGHCISICPSDTLVPSTVGWEEQGMGEWENGRDSETARERRRPVPGECVSGLIGPEGGREDGKASEWKRKRA